MESDEGSPKFISIPNPCFLFNNVVVRVKHYKIKIKINMFWVKTKSPLTADIENFATSRKKYITTPALVSLLHDFVKATGIENYDDITEEDIYTYVKSLRYSINTEYKRTQAIQALYLFMRYKKLEEEKKLQRPGRGRPAKIKRNQNIFALREEEGMSYDAIAKKYRLNKRTVYDIVKRLENKG